MEQLPRKIYDHILPQKVRKLVHVTTTNYKRCYVCHVWQRNIARYPGRYVIASYHRKRASWCMWCHQIMKNATSATCDKETSRGIKSAMLSQIKKRQRKHNVITTYQRTLAIWCTKRDKKTLARKKKTSTIFLHPTARTSQRSMLGVTKNIGAQTE